MDTHYKLIPVFGTTDTNLQISKCAIFLFLNVTTYNIKFELRIQITLGHIYIILCA